jgi:NAD(P)-dependent dehydrogenase (short-subunit alcohol dehydrogenase family)
VNAVAPGEVDTPMHRNDPKDFLNLCRRSEESSMLGSADTVLYLTEARQVTGEVLHVNGGAHVGKS